MEFKWMNESKITKEKNRICIFAPPETDFFVNSGTANAEGITPKSIANAPFYYTEVEGDFVMTVKVSHDFETTYDASSIMLWSDEKNWAKACFEQTDFDTHAVVSVVTKNTSDDANGCNIEGKEVWLKVCRRDNTFSFLYSIDGEHYEMMRFFSLEVPSAIKAGVLAQSPLGKGGCRYYENLKIEKKTVKNIRMGI